MPCRFQQVQDLVPFFLCKEGDFLSALHCFISSLNGPAARFTPHLFRVYLRIFDTATAPNLMITQPGQLCCPDAVWQPVKGQNQRRHYRLSCKTPVGRICMKANSFCSGRCGAGEAIWAGKVCSQSSEVLPCCLRWCKSTTVFTRDFHMSASDFNLFIVFLQSQCWAHVLTIFNTPAQPEPSSTFLQVCISYLFFWFNRFSFILNLSYSFCIFYSPSVDFRLLRMRCGQYCLTSKCPTYRSHDSFMKYVLLI